MREVFDQTDDLDNSTFALRCDWMFYRRVTQQRQTNNQTGSTAYITLISSMSVSLILPDV